MGRAGKKTPKHGQQDTHEPSKLKCDSFDRVKWKQKKYIRHRREKTTNEASTFTNELLTEMSTCLYFSLSCPFTLCTAKPSLNCHAGVMIVPVLINHSHRSKKTSNNSNNSGTGRNKTKHTLVCLFMFLCLARITASMFCMRAVHFQKAASLSLTFHCSKTINHKQFAFFILSFFHCDHFFVAVVVVGNSVFFSERLFCTRFSAQNQTHWMNWNRSENVHNLLQKSSEHRGKQHDC